MTPGRFPARGVLLGMAALVLAGALVMAGPRPTAAHSFLVATSPAQGERLAAAPDALVLEYSEAPDPSSLLVTLRTSDGKDISAPQPEVSGLEVRVPLEDLTDAIYLVAWETTSAVDGHGSAGELAFAVGDVAGEVPVSRTASSTDGWGVVATVLFVGGLALATGTFILRAIAQAGDGPPGTGAARLGLLLADRRRRGAGGGNAREHLAAVGDRRPAAGGARARGSAPGVGHASRPGGRRRRAVGRSQPRGDVARALGWLVAFVHLSAGAAWAGSLGLVVSPAGGCAGRDDPGSRWSPATPGWRSGWSWRSGSRESLALCN